ncbi:MAG: hypothetical protein HZC02_00270 [Candidatus Levybacteria bacterium]|nr:hypothetical protein [Candidatus Levybacteria bacterium]
MARIGEYFYGLSISFFCFVTLAAVDLLHVDAAFTLSKLVVPCFVAFFLWSFVYVSCMVIASVAYVILEIFGGLGLFIAPLLLGVVATRLANYVDDMDWFTIKSGWFSNLSIGLVLGAIIVVVSGKRLEIAFGAPHQRE